MPLQLLTEDHLTVCGLEYDDAVAGVVAQQGVVAQDTTLILLDGDTPPLPGQLPSRCLGSLWCSETDFQAQAYVTQLHKHRAGLVCQLPSSRTRLLLLPPPEGQLSKATVLECWWQPEGTGSWRHTAPTFSYKLERWVPRMVMNGITQQFLESEAHPHQSYVLGGLAELIDNSQEKNASNIRIDAEKCLDDKWQLLVLVCAPIDAHQLVLIAFRNGCS